MAPPSRRFGKPPTTRRYLAFRQHKRNELAIQRQLNNEPEEENDVAEPGSKKIISFRRPGLVGGTYTIQVQQTISEDVPEKDEPKKDNPKEDEIKENGKTSPDDAKTIKTTPVEQKFEVLAPQFDLPADSVYSIYPEQGHEATHDTLPHIVLNDSTLPWERIGSYQAEDRHPEDDYARNRVPWMALLIFSPDELRLDEAEKAGIFAHTSLKDPPPKQLESMAVRVPLGDLVKLKEGTARVPFGDIDIDQATKPDTNMIFPKAFLFDRLFAAYNDNGEPKRGAPDISRHRFLAHVVRMNTTDMANADSDEVDTTREFGVVVANRIGPLDGDKASQMIVHLVSLENVESLKPLPLPEVVPGSSPEQPARVGLVSLYSWSYTCLPPNSLKVKEAFDNIARTASMLKPIIPPQSEQHLDDVPKRMLNRLEDGYTLVRSITPTGETTAALFRGPLTPNLIAPLKWDLLSNTGSDLNIFDEKLGMMDITFSSAWSLGRTLALADRAFTISLTRVRHQILHPATSTARRNMLQATQRQSYRREDLVKSLDSLINETIAMSRSADETRWVQPASASPPDLSYASISPFTEAAIEEAAFEVAKSLTPDTEGGGWKANKQTPPYDELNDPGSPDWMIVLRFVLDLYYLVNVPSHYLMPDQSLVPRESLRFFFVDHNWIDAMVDGALSLGHQGGPGLADQKVSITDDVVRRAIKKAINRLFTDPTVHHPAVPRYGFYLRSAVAAQFPDLKVSVEVTGAPSGDPYLLRHDMIDKETMLGFFSDAPLKEGLHGLRFELPAHQQYFSLGSVTGQELEVAYKRQYTKPKVEDGSRNLPVATIKWPLDGKGKVESKNGKDTRERSQVFIWGSKSGLNDVRLVLVEKLAADVHTTLLEKMAKLYPATPTSDWYEDETATSAMMAYQLSSPSWQLQIGQMKANVFNTAETKAMVESISGCLSYREAPSSSLANTLDANTLLPPKIQSSIPAVCQRAIQRGTVGPPPHALWRVRQSESLLSPVPPRSPSQSSSSFSWEDTPRSALSNSPSPDDWGSDGFELIPRPHIPLPWEPTPVDPQVGLPEFDYHVSTTNAPAVKKIPILATKQDLIFSIVYSGKGKSFSLTKLTIDIPLTSQNGQSPMLEASLPVDAHAHMVSNLRFNARLRYSSGKQELQIEIKPRSQRGRSEGVKLRNWIGKWKGQEDDGEENTWAARTELSVVLYNVYVKRYPVGKGEEVPCKAFAKAYYAGASPERPDDEIDVTLVGV